MKAKSISLYKFPYNNFSQSNQSTKANNNQNTDNKANKDNRDNSQNAKNKLNNKIKGLGDKVSVEKLIKYLKPYYTAPGIRRILILSILMTVVSKGLISAVSFLYSKF